MLENEKEQQYTNILKENINNIEIQDDDINKHEKQKLTKIGNNIFININNKLNKLTDMKTNKLYSNIFNNQYIYKLKGGMHNNIDEYKIKGNNYPKSVHTKLSNMTKYTFYNFNLININNNIFKYK